MTSTAEHFAADVATHQLEVVRDDGLYRHLRARRPGTGMYWFDIITWPGSLTITGDMGTYVFAREEDMFPWFGYERDDINPHYWTQKLQAVDTNSGVREYSRDVFVQQIREHLTEDWTGLGPAALVAVRYAVETELLAESWLSDYDTTTEHGAREALDQYRGPGGFRFEDAWEWVLTEYSHQYLWCCHAILWAIKRYRDQRDGLSRGNAA